MKKNQSYIWTIAAVLAAAIASLYFLAKKVHNGKKLFNIDLSEEDIKDIDGIIRLTDIVAWFKSLNLNAEEDIPFIVDGERIGELIANNPNLSSAILAGVYAKSKDKVKTYIVFRGVALDKRLKDVLRKATSDNPIIVLN